ncbi:MAG: CPBP family glutamic-type intramembrane protease [Methylobacter sp.]
MTRKTIYSIVPLLVLLSAISLACIVGYFVFQAIDGRLPLSKIITKSTQLFLVLSIFPAMAYMKLNRGDLGFAAKALFFKQVLFGLGLGFATLLPVFIAQYALGINVIDQAQQWTVDIVIEKMLIALLVALLVSMIEEPIFRGILFAGLKKNMPVIAAILISSTYYAALHFLDSQSEITFQQANILSGFTLMGEAFANLLNPKILSAFLALLMVGVFLGVLRSEVKESLGLCIGCHTSWVWQIKMSKSLFNTDFNSEYLYLVSSYDGVVGPLVTAWLGLAIAGYFVYKKYSNP